VLILRRIGAQYFLWFCTDTCMLCFARAGRTAACQSQTLVILVRRTMYAFRSPGRLTLEGIDVVTVFTD
jgi:hypothetical protein